MDTQMTDGEINQSGSHLISIPLEVLLQITSSLTTPEYGNLRRTCKTIEASLFSSFSREFFTKRQFMVTEFSLQALVDISKSRYSTSLKHVIFGLERPILPNFRLLSHVGNGSNRPVLRNRLVQEYVSYLGLVNTGEDVEMLAEAFSNLASLETIGVRDFYSRSRNRDYPRVEWKSYGVSTYETETGSQLERIRQDLGAGSSEPLEQYISRIFINLFRALGKASSRPKSFEVILRQSSLHDHAFYLRKNTDSLIQPVLANLHTLFLDLNSQFLPVYVDGDSQPLQCPSYLLRQFLSKLPQLQHLRLNFHAYERFLCNNFLSWLAKPVSTIAPTSGAYLQAPPPVDLLNLQQLDIGMTSIEPDILVALMRKYQATLCIISFHKVTLWQPNLDTSGENPNLWIKVFYQLSKLDLKLRAINMSFLFQQLSEEHRVQEITFKDSRQPQLRKWAGPDVQSGLRDFQTFTTVVPIVVPILSDGDIADSDADDSDASMNDSDGDSDED
ncbi:hypothetical protein EG329_006073 [Mollisiaceae sp. DMI_Dod_QoI]|nr:hypothetical protein EG329_006073 [Helotiales sp. DMI_Dod_QoI]